MKKKTLFFFIQFFFILSLSVFTKDTSQVTVSISKLKGLIGERFEISLIVKSHVNTDDFTLDIDADNFEVLSKKDIKTEQSKLYTIREKKIEIVFWKTGDFKIKPIKVNLFKGKEIIEVLETNSLNVSIISSLKDKEKDEKNLNPLKPLAKVKGTIIYFLVYLFLLILIIGIGGLLIRYFKRRFERNRFENIRKLSPVEEYKKEWKKLKGSQFIKIGKIKLYFLSLTEIIKKFLSREYEFNAEELTSVETIMELKNKEDDGMLRDKFTKLLDFSDRVKFAKFIPDFNDFGALNELIDETIEVYMKREREKELKESENVENNI